MLVVVLEVMKYTHKKQFKTKQILIVSFWTERSFYLYCIKFTEQFIWKSMNTLHTDMESEVSVSQYATFPINYILNIEPDPQCVCPRLDF